MELSEFNTVVSMAARRREQGDQLVMVVADERYHRLDLCMHVNLVCCGRALRARELGPWTVVCACQVAAAHREAWMLETIDALRVGIRGRHGFFTLIDEVWRSLSTPETRGALRHLTPSPSARAMLVSDRVDLLPSVRLVRRRFETDTYCAELSAHF